MWIEAEVKPDMSIIGVFRAIRLIYLAEVFVTGYLTSFADQEPEHWIDSSLAKYPNFPPEDKDEVTHLFIQKLQGVRLGKEVRLELKSPITCEEEGKDEI